MITVSGKTFEHRETIKAIGGRFDGTTKSWTIRNALPTTLERLRALPGVVVTGDIDTSQEPAAPAPIIKRKTDYVRPYSVCHNKTNCFGDDMTYFNAFDIKNPVSFYGFSDFDTMLNYVEKLQPLDGVRNAPWDDHTEFRGSYSMDEAISIARNGWLKGVEMMKDVMKMLEGANVTQRIRKYDVAGSAVNVGRMLSNNPMHMVRRPRQPPKKIITLFVDFSAASIIATNDIIIRAACVGAIVDLLESVGYSCEIIGVASQTFDWNGDEASTQAAFKIKNAGETLNINNLAFAFGHPSLNRRIYRAIVASDRNLSDTYCTDFGFSGTAFAGEMNTNEFYIKKIGVHDKIKGYTVRERAASILNLIIPENLPITIKAE